MSLDLKSSLGFEGGGDGSDETQDNLSTASLAWAGLARAPSPCLLGIVKGSFYETLYFFVSLVFFFLFCFFNLYRYIYLYILKKAIVLWSLNSKE